MCDMGECVQFKGILNYRGHLFEVGLPTFLGKLGLFKKTFISSMILLLLGMTLLLSYHFNAIELGSYECIPMVERYLSNLFQYG